MKICVMGTRGFPLVQGGVEKHCESLYPLFGEKYKFIIFRRKSYVTSLSSYSNIKFIDLPSTRIKGFETFFHSFLSSVYSCFVKAQIVHIHNIGPALFAPIIRLFGKKVVLTYHSPNYEHDKWGYMAKLLLKFSEMVALHFSNAIIFVNKYQMEKFAEKIKKKSFYIPNGIPNITPTQSSCYIKSLGLIPQKYVIGVGRITPEKGFDVLIRAFERLETDFKLVIVGGVETESEYFCKLKDYIHSSKVVFTGYIFGEKLNEIYSNAAVYVLSSVNEGFPLTLLEAMKYRLDVIVTDIPATHLVKIDDNNYFREKNIDELTSILSRKLVKIRKVDYDLSEFDWGKISKEVTSVYNSVMN